MKKIMLFVGAVFAAVIMTGCGHNAITYGDGVGFDFGVNPENFTLSMNLRYGKILSAVTRDNVEIEMTGQADASGNVTPSAGASAEGQLPVSAGKGTAGVNTAGSLKVKIGTQVNGYTVDLERAKAKTSE